MVGQARAEYCLYTAADEAAPWISSDPNNVVCAQVSSKTCPDVDKVPWAIKYATKDTVAYTVNPGGCDKAALASQKKAFAEINCCRLVRAGKTIECSKKTNASDACVQTMANKFQPGDIVYSEKDACEKLDACKPAETGGTGTGTTATTDAGTTTSASSTAVWTKEECEGVTGPNGKKNVWVPPPQTPNAVKGNYCLIKPASVDLEINIGSVGRIKDIPHYINTVYKYVLGAGVLLAIILIIVSGFQWMLSGVAGQVKDARERMIKAALGLLLLFGAHLILYTINPQLLKLRAPAMVAIRPESLNLNASTSCEPGSQPDQCVKSKGPNFYCKPTMFKLNEECEKMAKNYQMIFWGAVASMVALPYAAEYGAQSIVTNGGLRTMVVNMAKQAFTPKKIVKDIAEGVVGEVTDKISESVGKTIGAALVPVAVGLGLVAALGNSKDPPRGICTELNQSLSDMQTCRFNKECQSGACLMTADLACGGLQLGICVSGGLRQPCALGMTKAMKTLVNKKQTDPTNQQVTDSKVAEGSEATIAAKAVELYGCKTTDAKCIPPMGNEENLGFCSDGSQPGMACNDSITCKNDLSCVAGTCRNAKYFDKNGKLIAWGAACFTAHDCETPSDASTNKATSPALCFKIVENHAEIWGLGTVAKDGHTNDLMDATQTEGVCIFDAPRRYIKGTGSSKEWGAYQPCFVNIGPSGKSTNETNKAVAAAIQQFAPAGSVWSSEYAAGIGFNIVGCGGLSKLNNSNSELEPGFCAVPVADIFASGAQTPGKLVAAGLCMTKEDFVANASGAVSAGNIITVGTGLYKSMWDLMSYAGPVAVFKYGGSDSAVNLKTVYDQSKATLKTVPNFYFINKEFQLF